MMVSGGAIRREVLSFSQYYWHQIYTFTLPPSIDSRTPLLHPATSTILACLWQECAPTSSTSSFSV
jgi:hypothetical protein